MTTKMTIETGKTKPPRYYTEEYARGRWHVIGPNRIPIYNGAPHGKDKPLIFRDEDAAMDCAERCNAADLDDTAEE